MIEDTEDDIGIIFKLEDNDVKVSLRDFGSYGIQMQHGRHIPLCSAICSTCCRTKEA
jgi:hypothetical protein